MSFTFLSGPMTNTRSARSAVSSRVRDGSCRRAWTTLRSAIGDHREVRARRPASPRCPSTQLACASTGSTLRPMTLTSRLSNSGLSLRDVAELGGADRREVLGMREQHAPGIAEPLMKANTALRRVGFEIRCDFAELECHHTSPSPIADTRPELCSPQPGRYLGCVAATGAIKVRQKEISFSLSRQAGRRSCAIERGDGTARSRVEPSERPGRPQRGREQDARRTGG